jgi:hypothetical protein
MSTAHLKLVKQEISDDVLAEVALELARKEEEDLQRLCTAVLQGDYRTAKKLAKEIKGNES